MTYADFGRKYGYDPDTVRFFISQYPEYGYKAFDQFEGKIIACIDEKAVVKAHELVYRLWIYNTNYLYFELLKYYKRDSNIARRLSQYNHIAGGQKVNMGTWQSFLSDGLFRPMSDKVLKVKPHKLQLLFFYRGNRMLEIAKMIKGESNGDHKL